MIPWTCNVKALSVVMCGTVTCAELQDVFAECLNQRFVATVSRSHAPVSKLVLYTTSFLMN